MNREQLMVYKQSTVAYLMSVLIRHLSVRNE